MLSFFGAIVLLVTTPGPGVLSLAGVGAAFGFRAGLHYMTGLFIGNNLVGLAVVTGLAALILANPVIRTVLAIASAGYLFYMAIRIALAGSKVGFSAATRRPGIVDGVLLQLINPKAYVVSTSIFSGFVILSEALLAEVILKFLLFNVVWIPVHFVWLWAGSALQRLDLPPRVQRGINLIMAAALVGVVLLAGLSLLRG